MNKKQAHIPSVNIAAFDGDQRRAIENLYDIIQELQERVKNQEIEIKQLREQN